MMSAKDKKSQVFS